MYSTVHCCTRYSTYIRIVSMSPQSERKERHEIFSPCFSFLFIFSCAVIEAGLREGPTARPEGRKRKGKGYGWIWGEAGGVCDVEYGIHTSVSYHRWLRTTICHSPYTTLLASRSAHVNRMYMEMQRPVTSSHNSKTPPPTHPPPQCARSSDAKCCHDPPPVQCFTVFVPVPVPVLVPVPVPIPVPVSDPCRDSCARMQQRHTYLTMTCTAVVYSNSAELPG